MFWARDSRENQELRERLSDLVPKKRTPRGMVI